MGLIDKKISDSEIKAKNVKAAPDRLTGTAKENKSIFDGLPELLASRMNGIIDSLTSAISGSSGAGEIGAAPTKEGGSENVQGQLEELQTEKVDKIEGKGLSANDFTDAMKEIYNTAWNRSHTHENKAVVDTITEIFKNDCDRLISLLSEIIETSPSVVDDDSKIPTCGAIVDFVSDKGGGDMLQMMYDPTKQKKDIFFEIYNFDCGYFVETVELHNDMTYSHQNLIVDGNAVGTQISQSLQEHEINPKAHQNLKVDGNVKEETNG